MAAQTHIGGCAEHLADCADAHADARTTIVAPPAPPPPPDNAPKGKSQQDQTEAAPAQGQQVQQTKKENAPANDLEALHQQAKSTAHAGDCATANAIWGKVQRMDSTFFKKRVAGDTDYSSCNNQDARKARTQRPAPSKRPAAEAAGRLSGRRSVVALRWAIAALVVGAGDATTNAPESGSTGRAAGDGRPRYGRQRRAAARHARGGRRVLDRGGNARRPRSSRPLRSSRRSFIRKAGNLGGGAVRRSRARRRRDRWPRWIFVSRRQPPRLRDMFVAQQPGDSPLKGPRASGVPGSVAGLWALHQRFGSKPWREARHAGDPVRRGRLSDHRARVAAADRRALQGCSRRRRSRSMRPVRQPVVADTVVKDPALGVVLEKIADDGPKAFYTGAAADAIAGDGGIITKDDLAAYTPVWRAPLTTSYRGYQLVRHARRRHRAAVVVAGNRFGISVRLRSARARVSFGWSPARPRGEALRRGFADRKQLARRSRLRQRARSSGW